MESFAKSKTALPTVSHHLLNLTRPVPTLGKAYRYCRPAAVVPGLARSPDLNASGGGQTENPDVVSNKAFPTASYPSYSVTPCSHAEQGATAVMPEGPPHACSGSSSLVGRRRTLSRPGSATLEKTRPHRPLCQFRLRPQTSPRPSYRSQMQSSRLRLLDVRGSNRRRPPVGFLPDVRKRRTTHLQLEGHVLGRRPPQLRNRLTVGVLPTCSYRRRSADAYS